MENHPYNTRRKKIQPNDKDNTVENGFKLQQAENLSQDLFSELQSLSQKTTSSQKAERDHLEKQITDFTWVQCDNPACQKWRRIPVSESHGLDEVQWFCNMGTLSQYNSCEAPEEDHRAYDKLARKLGLSYVLSHLAQGTLVWAKMAGYCRWPAMVTRDPSNGMSCEWDIDGEPQWYHVEFLGTKHTHGWIRARKVTQYGHRKEDNDLSKNYEVLEKSLAQAIFRRLHDVETLALKNQRRCRTKQMALNKAYQKFKLQRKTYQRMPVDDAIQKADELLPLTEEQRLTTCTFKYIAKPIVNYDKKTEQETEATVGQKPKNDQQRKCCQLCGGDTVKSTERKGKKPKGRPTKKQCNAVFPSSMQSVNGDSTKEVEDSQSGVHEFHFENLNFKSTLLDKSKEEKFKIDVEMYKRNEKAFDHDLRRFMDRNRTPIRRTPVWQHVPIGLFQLFLAVFERGGYQKVCESRSWTAVYKELTDMPVGQVAVGVAAKKYYERNLYPYELYVTGEDYKVIIDSIKKKKKKPQESTQELQPIMSENNDQVISVQSVHKDDCLESEENDEVDLEAMLSELEEYSKMCQLEDDVNTTQQRLGIDVTFHDDSSGSIFSPGVVPADTASEFGLSCLPDEEAQIVPNLSKSSLEIDHDNLSQSEQMLQELQALDNEFQQLEEEMTDFT